MPPIPPARLETFAMTRLEPSPLTPDPARLPAGRDARGREIVTAPTDAEARR